VQVLFFSDFFLKNQLFRHVFQKFRLRRFFQAPAAHFRAPAALSWREKKSEKSKEKFKKIEKNQQQNRKKKLT